MSDISSSRRWRELVLENLTIRKRDPKEFYQAFSKDTAQPDHHGNQSTNLTLPQRACIKLLLELTLKTKQKIRVTDIF